MRIRLNSRGDTIVEVLMSIAVLSLVLSISYGMANRSTQANRQAQERAEAQKLTEEQLELIRGYASNDNPWDNSDICFYFEANDDRRPKLTTEGDKCRRGVDGRYNLKITYDSPNNTYTVKTIWDNVKGGQDQLSLAYKLPTTQDAPPTPPPPAPATDLDAEPLEVASPGATTKVTWSTDEAAVKCIKRFPPAESEEVDLSDPNAARTGSSTHQIYSDTTFTISCFNSADRASSLSVRVTVFIPPPTINLATKYYGAWHMYNDGNTPPNNVKQTQEFRISNPSSSPNSVTISEAVISGGNADSFHILSSATDCTPGKVIPPGGYCRVTVYFLPPSGLANNRLANAGKKTATLTVSNSNGLAAAKASLSGYAVTDRLAPGDVLVSASSGDPAKYSIRGYSPSCYNNAFSCSSGLIQWDGVLALYPDVTVNNAVWIIPGAVKTEMRASDGALVVYNSTDTVIWFRGGAYGGVWLQVFGPPSAGHLWRMVPSWNTSITGHSRIWP